jgi:D-glycero-D-manno-heptose 1,7-bisphosphate phosphatase
MANKAIFLDRDDTLIEDPGYINHPDQVKLLDGVAEALRELKEMGYKLVVVSNQSAVARGIVTEEVLDEIHNRLKQMLAEKGAFLDQIYYCPYHPDGVIPKYRKESDWRKPSPGMLVAAAEEMDIDLGQSWSIGDSRLDVEAGSRAGCKTILIDHSPYPKQSGQGEVAADYRAVNIKEAVNIIKRYHRGAGEMVSKVEASSMYQTEPVSKKLSQDTECHSESFAALEDKSTTRPADESCEEPLISAGQTLRPDLVGTQGDSFEIVSKTDKTVLQADEAVLQTDEPVLQAVEEPSEPELTEPQTVPAEQEIPADKTIELLGAILGQLKSMQRANMFSGEFSITRLMAGVVQIAVLFCLLITIWFLMSPTRQDNSVLIALGFAAVLQMMALTLYIMQGRK